MPVIESVADIRQSEVLSAGGLSDAVIDQGPQLRTAFMSLLASMLPASDLKTLTVREFNTLIPILVGEVMSNQRIRTILRDRASEALKRLNQTNPESREENAMKAMLANAPLNAPLNLVAGSQAPHSTPFVGSSESQSAYASLLASLISAKEMSGLTLAEYNLLIAALAGEVMTNPDIHAALKARAAKALAELRG